MPRVWFQCFFKTAMLCVLSFLDRNLKAKRFLSFLAKTARRAFKKSFMPSSRTSNGISRMNGWSSKASFLMYFARKFFFVNVISRVLEASTHLLYVHRAAPNHDARIRCCFLVGYTRILIDSIPHSFAPAFVSSGAFSVISRHKDGSDGKQVVGKFLFTRHVWIFSVNQEFRVGVFEDGLQELDSVSTQSVFVHNHNFSDHTLECAFQKGLKSFSCIIESGGDVVEDDVVGESALEVVDLTLEIFLLMGAANAGVDDVLRFWRGGRDTEVFFDVVDVVESFPCFSISCAANALVLTPSSQSSN